MANLVQFENQDHINLETYRKNGVGVKTPVWFVLENGKFFIGTLVKTGKMKRVRQNSRVRIAPCMSDGELSGEWIEGRASIIEDSAIKRHIFFLLVRKYGLPILFYVIAGQFSRGRNGYLLVVPSP